MFYYIIIDEELKITIKDIIFYNKNIKNFKYQKYINKLKNFML